MGRRKFGPQTGPWTDDEWCGWWGDETPFETTVFVMTHYPRPTIDFANGTSFHVVDGTPVIIHADAVILAAGGHNRIWRNTSSRRDENTGDSFRLAALVGGRIRDAELVQFHPSGILEPADAAGTLVSEAARGEGGILQDHRHQPRAVVRREAVVLAVQEVQVALHHGLAVG